MLIGLHQKKSSRSSGTHVPHSVPHSVPKAAPPSAPKVVPPTAPKAVPHRFPHTLPHTLPHTVPKVVPVASSDPMNSYNDSFSSNSGWVWGRWLLFIVVIVAFVLYVFLVNVRRRKLGRKPIVGTSWLAPPPAYGASQQQYNQPVNENPVPEYTEAVNDNDAGYFDNEGKFHPTQRVSPVAAPEPAVTSPSVPYTQPYQAYPPYSAQTAESPSLSTTTSSASSRYVRPSVPPPNTARTNRQT